MARKKIIKHNNAIGQAKKIAWKNHEATGSRNSATNHTNNNSDNNNNNNNNKHLSIV